MSGIRFTDCSKLDINRKNDNGITISRHDVIVKFFWRHFLSLLTFSYRSKFHVNIITGSGVMAIYFYNRLARNSEIGNTPVWVLPNVWRLGQVRDTKFGMNVPNKILLNAAKCQGYSFYCVWVIKGKPKGQKGRGVKLPEPLPEVYQNCIFELISILQAFLRFRYSQNLLVFWEQGFL